MRKRIGLAMMMGLALAANGHAANCGEDDYSKWCEMGVSWAGTGASSSGWNPSKPPLFKGNTVYISLKEGSEERGWFWTSAENQNQVLATALAAKNAGTQVQVRYVVEGDGSHLGNSRILSIIQKP